MTDERLTLPEELLLVGWHDTRGSNDATQNLPMLLAGATVMELALREAVTIADGRPHATGTRTGHPALDRTLDEIRDSRRARTTKAWVQRLGSSRWLRAAVLEDLVARGTVRADTRRVLGVFTVTRHPVADNRGVADLRQRVTRVLTQPEPVVDPRDAVLGGLVHSAGGKLLRRLVPGDQRRGARQRAKALSKGEAMSARRCRGDRRGQRGGDCGDHRCGCCLVLVVFVVGGFCSDCDHSLASPGNAEGVPPSPWGHGPSDPPGRKRRRLTLHTMRSSEERNVQIEVWADVVCPWCAIGRARLQRVLATFAHRDTVAVRWRSFELDPSAPPTVQGAYVDRLARKYGTSTEQAQAMIDRMTAQGAAEGLTFRFDIAQPGNTFNAHRLLHLAADRGVQSAVTGHLMTGYLSEGAAIGDPGALARLAAAAGLDASEVASILASDAYADAVRADERQARAFGISGVPFFVIDQRYGISGAQPVPVLQQVLTRVWDEATA